MRHRRSDVYSDVLENYGYCLQKNAERLSSPEFEVKALGHTSWRLALYPRGFRDDSFVSLFLERRESTCSRKQSPEMDFTLAIHTNGGTLLKTQRYRNQSFRVFDVVGDDNFLKRDELFRKSWSRLFDGTLLIHCQILKSDVFRACDYEQCIIQTRIEIERKSFNWSIDDFENALQNQRRYHNVDFKLSGNSMRFDIFSLGGHINMDILRLTSVGVIFLICEIVVTDHSDSLNEVLEAEHFFNSEENVFWHFPNLILKNRLPKLKQHRSNKVLKLQFECVTVAVCSKKSKGTAEDFHVNFAKTTISKIVHKLNLLFSDQLPLSNNQTSQINQFDDQLTSSITNHSLPEDLQFAFQNKILCDFKLQSGKEVFPVHKMILGARSKVFRAMFENDMMEAAAGQVEIQDVDSDTLKRLLLFLYADKMEELQWECVSKLYIAADKYEILPLKKRCSNVLKKELCLSNACEILLLADMHQDSDLKRAVQDFILAHDKEVLRSEYWDIFEAKNVKLAVETMKHIYLKKLGD